MRQATGAVSLFAGCLMAIAMLGAGNIAQGRVEPAAPAGGSLTVTLDAGRYALHEGDAGQTHIQMSGDFGSFGMPGEPELPGHTFLIALPPGAQVTGVHFETPGKITLPGQYRIAPVPPAVSDLENAGQAMARWEARREQAYAGDQPYPAQVGQYLGQGQWRRYTYARVAYQPFSYRPRSGVLHYYPTLVVTIEYRLPEPHTPAWREVERLRDDHVLDDIIAPQLVNFDQARVWYDGSDTRPRTTAASQYDYVIIVQNDAMTTTVAPFKAWKESLGHTVKVVTVDWIRANYSGADVGEEVWNFLHDKYPASAWGIRYVLLVGDLRIIPTMRLYYSDPPKEWGLRSDHFFAKLSGGDTSAQVWNKDGDRRWGEIDGDEMSVVPDVLVGRIPLNTAADVGHALNAIINFEQDKGGWKHRALLGGGYNDIKSATQKTDNAVLMEYIRNHLLDPNGWSYTRMYEQSGLGTSVYAPPPDYDTSRANFVTAWNASDHGLAVFADHGSTRGLSGHVWHHDTLTVTNQVDPGEWVWSDLLDINDVNALTNTHPAIVELLGCSTLMLVTSPWPDYSVDANGVPTKPGGYVDNTGRRFLATGKAAGVVGFASPTAYKQYWSAPTVFGSQTAGYYFTENLVKKHYTLGWSLYEAKIRYANNYYHAGAYEPIPWAFTLFGDPSMILEGYDTSAKGTNTTIHTGAVYAYGTDNADNGDMYVAVSTSGSDTDGSITVYKSTDHGQTWSSWATVSYGSGIQAVDVVVGEWGSGELADNRLHVFFAATDGTVWDNRISLSTVGGDAKQIANEGSGKTLPAISAARDPVATTFNLYVSWEVDTGSSSQVKVARSTTNGTAWTNEVAFDGYQQPHVDAGPSDHVYLTAVGSSFPNDVFVKRSTDRGVSWGSWTNLTSGDNGDYHGAPAVAASTDGAIPTVWVAYNYYETVTYGGADLRFAYSKDGGSSWTLNQVLSGEPGVDEMMPDMVGYRAAASRWMNIAYDHSQSSGMNVIWRWASGSTPDNWWSPRLMNDHDSHPAIGPQVIYSPGAAATGSGVVYPGTGSPVTNLYFAAPWLTLMASDTASTKLAARQPYLTPWHVAPSVRGQGVSQAEAPRWAFTGDVGRATRVAGLARSPSGSLYAATTTREVDNANTGTVFRSDNGGTTWEPVPALPMAWWLESILVTDSGALLVGGTSYDWKDPDAVEHGVIYRSTDGGESWAVAFESLDATVVHALLQRANGDIVAGTGPGGVVLSSQDDGANWQPLATPPSADHLYALLETSDGTLFAAGTGNGGKGAVYRFTGTGWQETSALDNATAVYALLEDSNHALYAGAAYTDESGRVFRSSDAGQNWLPSDALGNSRAVRALLEGSNGKVYAGVDVGPGRFTSYVYSSEDGGMSWQDAGSLFMADAVYDFLLMPDGSAYAASGDTYGVIFRATALVMGNQIYLPLIQR